jgi:hypothetical protein
LLGTFVTPSHNGVLFLDFVGQAAKLVEPPSGFGS